MNPDEEIVFLESIIDQILRGLQEILQSGEILTDQFQRVVAQELNWATERIDALRSENPVEELSPTPTPQPELTQAIPSSNIEGFAYDDKTNRLLVRFLGDYPNREGPIYAYEGIPKVIFELFQSGAIPARTDGKNQWGKWWKGKVPSIGASMYTLIKNGGYPYQRLT